MMDCHFCDGPAEMQSGRPQIFKYQITCAKCGMCGVPMLDNPDGSGPARAVQSWNRLQSLIAKGLLHEAIKPGSAGRMRL